MKSLVLLLSVPWSWSHIVTLEARSGYKFSLQYQYIIKHKRHENLGNDKNLISPYNIKVSRIQEWSWKRTNSPQLKRPETIWNVWRPVRRNCILTLKLSFQCGRAHFCFTLIFSFFSRHKGNYLTVYQTSRRFLYPFIWHSRKHFSSKMTPNIEIYFPCTRAQQEDDRQKYWISKGYLLISP